MAKKEIRAGRIDAEEQLTNLCGALYLPSVWAGDPAVYAVCPVDKLDKLLNLKDPHQAQHIVDPDPEAIRLELEQRYPAPEGASRILFVENYSYSARVTKHNWRNEEYDERQTIAVPAGWVVMPKPLFTGVESLEELKALTQQHGPVCIPRTLFDLLFSFNDTYRSYRSAHAEAEGYTYTDFTQFDVCRVNYNPRAFELREYRKKLAAYKSRLVTTWTHDVIWSLVGYVNPRSWPEAHPYHDMVRGPEMWDRAGWGWRPRRNYEPHHVLELLEINRKLDKRTWWRESTHTYAFASFDRTVTVALQRLHAIEAHWSAEAKRRPTDDEARSYLDLCRWLRREAGALGIRIPKPPVKPITPAAKAKAAKLRRQARNARRRNLRIQPELFPHRRRRVVPALAVAADAS